MPSLYKTRVYRLTAENGTVDNAYVSGIDLAAFKWVTDPAAGAYKRLMSSGNEWMTANRWHACITFRSGCSVYAFNYPALLSSLMNINRLENAESPAIKLLTEAQAQALVNIIDRYSNISGESVQLMVSTFLLRVAELQSMLDGGLSMATAAEMAAWYTSTGNTKLGLMLDNAAAVLAQEAINRRNLVENNTYTTTSDAFNNPGTTLRAMLDTMVRTDSFTGVKTIDVPALAAWIEDDFSTLVDPALNITFTQSALEIANLLPPYITPAKLGYTRTITQNVTVTAAGIAAKKAEVDASGIQIERHYATFAPSSGDPTLENLIVAYLETIDLKSILPEVVARVVDSRFYVQTWVTSWGEESAPGPVSELIEADQNDVVLVTPDLTVPSSRGITGYRLYRSNAGTSTAEFQLVPDLKTISNPAAVGEEIYDKVINVYKELSRNGTPGVPESKLLSVATAVAAMSDTALRTYILNDTDTNGTGAMQATAKALKTSYVNLDGTSFSSFTTSQTTYNDAVKGSALGEVLPSTTWTTPNAKLKGLTAMANGVMAGYFDNTLCFCEAYVPYAWPVEYEMPMDYPIVGLAAIGQSLFVFTRGATYIVSGSDPSSMSSNILAGGQACSSARSIVVLDGGVAFASPEGICVAGGDKVSVITAGIFTKTDWTALDPTSIIGTQHDGVYYFKATNKSYALDLATGKLMDVAISGTAFYHNKFDDKLYVADGTSVKEVFGATTNRTVTYRTGIIKLPKHTPFAWLQVDSDFKDASGIATSVVVKWYGDGELIHTETMNDRTATVTSITPVRLPAGRYLEHEIEIITNGKFTSVTLAGSTAELQNG